jgi:hypothetical protein
MILGQFGWWNLWLLAGPLSWKIPAALDSVSNAKASHAPAVFLLAENDEVVAPKFQVQVLNAYAGEKRMIGLPAARHNSPLSEAALGELNGAMDRFVLGHGNLAHGSQAGHQSFDESQ